MAGKIKGRTKKIRVNITVQEDVWREFQRYCGDLHMSASQTVEFLAKLHIYMGLTAGMPQGMKHCVRQAVRELKLTNRSDQDEEQILECLGVYP